MSTIKVILTINDLGGHLSMETKKTVINWKMSTQDNPNEIIKTGIVIHNERIEKFAKKKIHLSEEAYNFMTSPKDMPSDYNKYKNFGKQWRDLSRIDRLKFHCNQIANGHPFVVEVLD